MTVNETCVPGEGQCSRPVPESTSTVLIVSLMAVFLLVSIITGLIAYKLRNRFQFRLRRSQTKEEDGGEAIQVPCKPYRPTDLSREESAGPGETPIYENLATQPGRYNNCRVSQSRYVTREVPQALTGSLCFLGLCASIKRNQG